jgi:hypothetical protein
LRPGELSADERRGQKAEKDCRKTNSQRACKCCAKAIGVLPLCFLVALLRCTALTTPIA